MAGHDHFDVPHPQPGLSDLQIQQNFQAASAALNAAGGGGGGGHPDRVTTLPESPSDGDEVYYAV